MKHLTEEQINEYFDQELGGEAMQETERHLESCSACRHALEELRSLASALAGMPVEAQVGDLTPAVLAEIAPRRLSLVWRLVLAVQGGTLLGLVILVLQNLGGWWNPQEWLEQGMGLLLRLEEALPDIPLHLSLPAGLTGLELNASPALLGLLGGSALLLLGVGNALLLKNGKEVRK